jgi:hypothetical protein
LGTRNRKSRISAGMTKKLYTKKGRSAVKAARP